MGVTRMTKLLLALGLAAAGLLLAVSLAFADGGPHGGFTNTGAGCAGCHRTHTAQAAKLLATDQANLCFSCHDGTGSKLDAWDGASLSATVGGRAGTGQPAGVDGALKSGGFVYARIDSGNATTPGVALGNSAGGVPTTSAHMKWGQNGLAAQNTIWGSGTSGAGQAISSLVCGDCHNPHGNGNYRILRPQPNYGASSVTLADEATKSYTTANYWDTYKVGVTTPWTQPQMSQWCATCHTRYQAGMGSINSSSGDATFMYRHPSDGNIGFGPYNASCVQCHVAHGSNASMNGDGKTNFSSKEPWPGGTTARGNESTLLKIDNRGTCVACHGTKP